MRTISIAAACAVLCTGQQPPERTIPARTIPVPTTVSPEMQKLIAPAWSGSRSPMTLTSDQWKALQKQNDEASAKALQLVKQKFHVSLQEERICLRSSRARLVADRNSQDRALCERATWRARRKAASASVKRSASMRSSPSILCNSDSKV